MAKITPYTSLLLLLCFSSFLSYGLSIRSPKSSLDSYSAVDVDDEEFILQSDAAGKGEDWFHWGFPHPHPWPHAHPPLPENFPKIHWPFVHPPMPAGGFKSPPKQWPHWPFVHPPMPAGGFQSPPKQWPHWPFVHPPMPAGGFKSPPRQWPHWPFVHPPMPAGGFKSPPMQWPHWPFVHPPMPAGAKPHWPFVHPPYPSPWWRRHGSESADSGRKIVDATATPAA